MLEGRNQPDNKADPQYKPVILAAVLATILPMAALFYKMGQQQEQLIGSINSNRLEVTAEFTEKLSDNRQYVMDNVSGISGDIRDIIQANNSLMNEVKSLEDEVEELKEKQEEKNKDLEEQYRVLKSSSDSLYRNQQYLKSLHNINQPPPR